MLDIVMRDSERIIMIKHHNVHNVYSTIVKNFDGGALAFPGSTLTFNKQNFILAITSAATTDTHDELMLLVRKLIQRLTHMLILTAAWS